MDPITLVESIPAVGPYIPYVVAAGAIAAAIATILPAPSPAGNKVYAVVYTAINWLALNVGKAKNAAPAEPPSPKA